MTGRDGHGDTGLNVGKQYYAMVRSVELDLTVETGVRNGVSTLCLLLTIRKNGHGSLHSIDIPYCAESPFRNSKRKHSTNTGSVARVTSPPDG